MNCSYFPVYVEVTLVAEREWTHNSRSFADSAGRSSAGFNLEGRTSEHVPEVRRIAGGLDLTPLKEEKLII